MLYDRDKQHAWVFRFTFHVSRKCDAKSLFSVIAPLKNSSTQLWIKSSFSIRCLKDAYKLAN